MAYSIVPDGAGGWAAQHIPATGAYPASTTGIKVDAAGNPVTSTPDQYAELLRLHSGQLPARGEMPPPAGLADAALTPEQAAQIELDALRVRDAVMRQASAVRPDDDTKFVDDLNNFAELDGAVRDENDPAVHPPRTESERTRREQAARRLAASFGYTLAWCPNQSDVIHTITGQARHDTYACVANAGTWYEHVVFAGELPHIETKLRYLDGKRASKAVLDAARLRQLAGEKVPAIRLLTEEQAHAESPAGQAELAARRVAALEATVARLLAERGQGDADA